MSVNLDHKVDWAELTAAMQDGCWQRRYYLDRDTGRVHLVTELQRCRLQDVYDIFGEEAAEQHIDDALLLQAHHIEMDDVRFVKVPVVDQRSADAMRDAFAAQSDPALRPLLWRALDSTDPTAFDRLLTFDDSAAQNWQTFYRANLRAELRRWLHQIEDVALVHEPAASVN